MAHLSNRAPSPIKATLNNLQRTIKASSRDIKHMLSIGVQRAQSTHEPDTIDFVKASNDCDAVDKADTERYVSSLLLQHQ